MRLGVAGDWHGNRTWALRCVRALADAGVGEVYHLGDFGIWPGPRGRDYLLDLDAVLGSHAMELFVTPGNHEDYDQIAELPALDRGHDIGQVQWITDDIALLLRGHRWERKGWSFLSLGGAPSVDRWSRREGLDWWEAEAITDEDVARVVEGGRADVMLAHDAPDAALGTRGVASVLRSNPIGWPAHALRYATEGRDRMTAAFLAVEPRLFLHGHYHLRDETWIDKFDHRTHVVSLDCDGAPVGNLLVLSLPDQDSGEEPAIEWLTLPAGRQRDQLVDDPIAPKSPMVEWTVDEIVKVLDDGRSVHWKALTRVARRDDGFASLLDESLSRTSNRIAVDYLSRVLRGGPEPKRAQ